MIAILFEKEIAQIFDSNRRIVYIIEVRLNQLILILMYTHAYTEYVNHILNRSPSKTTYSFAKAERFPPSKSEKAIAQPFMQANGFQYRDGAQRYAQAVHADQPNQHQIYRQRKQNEQFAKISKKYIETPERLMEGPSRKSQRYLKSRSKSPLPSYSRNLTKKQNSNFIDNKEQYKVHDYSAKYTPNAHATSFYDSPSKSPKKSTRKLSKSPSKTFTQQLHQIDHVSKNITINGYYPTGTELSPDGKYPTSKIRNSPGYRFGSSPPKQRYSYIVKTSDPLGPGYYDQFSEFGSIKK